MADREFIYQVARIRAKELTLLSAAFIRQLLSASSADECVKLLKEKSWGADDATNIEELLRGEREKTWALMREMVEDISVFDVFLYSNDYHNLKAAMKSVLVKQEQEGLYINQGTVNLEDIKKAVVENDMTYLPERMRDAARNAYDILLHTGDSQQSDVIIDRAALDDIYRVGKSSFSEFLQMYAELTVACADIKIAIRAARTGKDKSFLKQALAPCDSLNIELLANAAFESEQAVCEYLSLTAYSDAAETLADSISAFEVWCDNYLIKAMKSQLCESFGIGPLAAYVLARENEIKTVRLVLSGKQNSLPDEVVEERIREMYV